LPISKSRQKGKLMTAIAYVETAFPNVHAASASLHQGAGIELYTTGSISTGQDPHCGHGTGLFTTGLQSGPQASDMATGGLTGLFTTGC
jgi:hypothetical protein